MDDKKLYNLWGVYIHSALKKVKANLNDVKDDLEHRKVTNS